MGTALRLQPTEVGRRRSGSTNRVTTTGIPLIDSRGVNYRNGLGLPPERLWRQQRSVLGQSFIRKVINKEWGHSTFAKRKISQSAIYTYSPPRFCFLPTVIRRLSTDLCYLFMNSDGIPLYGCLMCSELTFSYRPCHRFRRPFSNLSSNPLQAAKFSNSPKNLKRKKEEPKKARNFQLLLKTLAHNCHKFIYTLT